MSGLPSPPWNKAKYWSIRRTHGSLLTASAVGQLEDSCSVHSSYTSPDAASSGSATLLDSLLSVPNVQSSSTNSGRATSLMAIACGVSAKSKKLFISGQLTVIPYSAFYQLPWGPWMAVYMRCQFMHYNLHMSCVLCFLSMIILNFQFLKWSNVQYLSSVKANDWHKVPKH